MSTNLEGGEGYGEAGVCVGGIYGWEVNFLLGCSQVNCSSIWKSGGAMATFVDLISSLDEQQSCLPACLTQRPCRKDILGTIQCLLITLSFHTHTWSLPKVYAGGVVNPA